MLTDKQIGALGVQFGFACTVGENDDEIIWFDGNPTDLIRAAIQKALEGAIPATFEYVTAHVIYLRNDDEPFTDDWDFKPVLVLLQPED